MNEVSNDPCDGGRTRALLEPGLRSVFIREFEPKGYDRSQENKLRNRKQRRNETASEYSTEYVMDLCRLVDSTMAEQSSI